VKNEAVYVVHVIENSLLVGKFLVRMLNRNVNVFEFYGDIMRGRRDKKEVHRPRTLNAPPNGAIIFVSFLLHVVKYTLYTYLSVLYCCDRNVIILFLIFPPLFFVEMRREIWHEETRSRMWHNLCGKTVRMVRDEL